MAKAAKKNLTTAVLDQGTRYDELKAMLDERRRESSCRRSRARFVGFAPKAQTSRTTARILARPPRSTSRKTSSSRSSR